MELTPSAQVLADEARRRGIRVQAYLDIAIQYVLLEYQEHREFLYQSLTDRIGAVTQHLLKNKGMTQRVLQEAGFPVPEASCTQSMEEALNFLAKYKKIVVKPRDGSLGMGVTPGITTEAGLRAAWARVLEYEKKSDPQVVCQHHVEGKDYRIMVVDEKHVYVATRVPAHVVGNAQHTIRDLVGQRNKERWPNYQIRMDDQAQEVLLAQGLDWKSVPGKEQNVWLARVANTSAGGTIHDIPVSKIPASIINQARTVAAYFRAPLVGIDCISPDIQESFGKIVELNPAPSLIYPESHVTQGLVSHMIDMLFPETKKK